MPAPVALLLGINVGVRNAVALKVLGPHVEAGRYTHGKTYIQSGNVLFSADHTDARAIELDLQERIEAEFGLPVPVVVRSADEVQAAVDSAPAVFGDPEYRCDVIFLKHPLSAEDAFAALPTPREGVDQAWIGPG